MNKFLNWVLIAVFFMGAVPAFALEPEAGDTLMSHLGARMALSWGLGKMGTSSGVRKSRTMSTLGLHAMPGYKVGNFMPAISFEYQFSFQVTEASSNLKGSGYLLGVGTTYKLNDRIVLLGAVDFFGRYGLSYPSSSQSYDRPLGFRVGGDYRCPNLPVSIGAFFKLGAYSRLSGNGKDFDIYSSKLNYWSGGIAAVYNF